MHGHIAVGTLTGVHGAVDGPQGVAPDEIDPQQEKGDEKVQKRLVFTAAFRILYRHPLSKTEIAHSSKIQGNPLSTKKPNFTLTKIHPAIKTADKIGIKNEKM